MTTFLRRLLGSLIIMIGGLALIAPARAADAVITYQLPSNDLTGMTAQTAPGVGSCIAGCASLRLAPGAAVPARRQAMLAFAAPPDTTIVNAALRLRYRTKQPAVSAHLQSKIGGRWLEGQRLRSTAGTTTTVNTGRGASAVAVTLTADGAVPARVVKSDAENVVSVDSVVLTVRDLVAPSIAWSNGDPATAGWQRGALCGAFAARDAGLGVDRVELAVGSVVATTAAAGGSRLQPRPAALDGTICLDTAQVGDGTFGTALSAVDTGALGNRSTALTGLIRIDNTAPAVVYAPPVDAEARLPVSQLVATDATSGIDQVTATIDGLPAAVRTVNGLTTVTPIAALADGTHRLAWAASDVAGNVATGGETFGVVDTTPPVIDDVQPSGVVQATAVVSAHAIDTGAGLAPEGWRLAIDGVDVTGAAEPTSTGGITYAPLRPWSEGEHTVRVTAVDRSGNRAVRTWTFSLPITPSTPQSVAPMPISDAPIPVADAPPSRDEGTANTSGAVSSRLTLRSEARRLRRGSEVRLHGRLAGAAARRVRIEARVGRHWLVVIGVPISAAGTFSTAVRLPAAGGYDVRARAGRLTSPVVHLTAR